MTELLYPLADEAATEALGMALAVHQQLPAVVFLHGDLGAGKTTLSRGVMRGFGHQGAVKSPTYTLVEPYQFDHHQVYHFDLYRLADPEELEFMGIREYFDDHSLCLIEWPECGQGILPAPDLEITLTYEGQGRVAHLVAHSESAKRALEALSAN
ncbi:tRNA (adenosine(37)-N6)-threonylcarbamoyltransferase complex ATPase subunit type 1 TsaE [Neiella marina]|uniref:tRNA threonylcarbamoyladenosine biosynthesis protein TsaE n=1 Tax=Neiella marina TaxID=508461 RepID=A0A8J2UAB2_9GAMM|nr:tRNA (adenosine(37)-N6)-threonylcarbamoyltransferase complex ATPase subunit type 1 TsaE [Neiella marina]GGA89943.1 tRNA (adenosine(37)-N6)-threonylcarbamoyltransferase complex ATPase subunit type 1 TsaE [Neiella marina]